MNYRNQKLLKLASRAPHCMNPACGTLNRGQIVACHSNSQRHGKGTGLKAHDITAYLCGHCHDMLDGRTGNLTREEKERLFADALFETWLWLMREGLLEVAA